MPRNDRPTTVYPMALRELEVVRVTDVTPGMRRVTLSGEQLHQHIVPAGFTQLAFESPGFDDDVRLLFPEPGRTTPVLPTVTENGVTFPKDRKVLAKVYTVRAYDPATHELDIDFVKHGVGIATTWAYRTKPGDRIHVAGPSISRGIPTGFDWLLIAGDDTALPAIARLLDEAPDHLRAQVFIEIAEDAHRQQLRDLPGVRVNWLPRDGAEPGTVNRLLSAVRTTTWWDGPVFAWIAGEQAIVRDLRRHLIEERSLDKTHIDFTGYWRREKVVVLDSDSSVPDPEKNEHAFARFHELAELLPPLAIRVAANLGVGEHISRGTATAADLAQTTGVDEHALGKLLRYLHSIELLEPTGEGYQLSETGEFLAHDHVLDIVRSDGVTGRRELAFFGLEHAVRTGAAAYETVTGHDYATLRRDEDFEHRHLEKTATTATFLGAALANTAAFATTKHLVIHSPGASALAIALTTRHRDLRVTIPALPTAAQWLRQDLADSVPDDSQLARIDIIEQGPFELTPSAEAILCVRVLGDYPDADAAYLLRRAAESLEPGGLLYVIDGTLNTEQLDEHEAEADLLSLALTGSGLRTPAELNTVFADAGLHLVTERPVRWANNTLRILRPGTQSHREGTR